MQTLFFILVIAGLIFLWWQQMQLHERALRAARDYCARMELQLLDESIGFRGFRRYSIDFGRKRWMRSYQFEFTTTGEERYKGEVLLHRGHLFRIRTPAYRIP